MARGLIVMGMLMLAGCEAEPFAAPHLPGEVTVVRVLCVAVEECNPVLSSPVPKARPENGA
jgi:hypothetical protein